MRGHLLHTLVPQRGRGENVQQEPFSYNYFWLQSANSLLGTYHSTVSTKPLDAYTASCLRAFRNRTVVSTEPFGLEEKLGVRPEEALVHGRLQVQAEVGLAGHRLRQKFRQRFAAPPARMPAVRAEGYVCIFSHPAVGVAVVELNVCDRLSSSIVDPIGYATIRTIILSSIFWFRASSAWKCWWGCANEHLPSHVLG